MRSEMNIEVRLDQKEKLFISEVNGILDDIIRKLQDYKENGHYPFVDHIDMPEELRQTADRIAEIGRLML